ncbi:MAG: MFS transporter [Chitinophagales bacterium]|nr:MFS transporter [Chitinophagales bacterium]
MKRFITRTILLLSVVSFFTDISSEMLYPVMPLFLQSIGFTTVMIGVLEGLAEAIAGLSKMYFGSMSDAIGRRMPFVRVGYIMSALSKPVLFFIQCPPWVFFSRTLDRLGKGVRTGARDALLSDEASSENKGKVFGFHRAMDTAGAAIGPLAALLYLQFHPGNYQMLFLLAFLPAALSVFFTLLIRDRKPTGRKVNQTSFAGKFSYWKKSPPPFRKLMTGLLFFALMNSSDLFLLLRAKEITGNDQMVLSSYILYNLVFALFAFPLGRLADRIGLLKMLLAGLGLFVIVYAGMSRAETTTAVIALLVLYGIYAAATEGISKALISNMVPQNETASAVGFYTGWNSICALIASSVAGWIWYAASPQFMFLISASGAAFAVLFLFVSLRKKSV